MRNAWQPAGQYFQDVLRYFPEDCFSWICLGEIYAQTGKWEASLKCLSYARELEPDNWLSLILLGRVQLQVGQLEDSIQTFGTLIEKADSGAELGLKQSLADAYYTLGKDQEAKGFAYRAEGSFIYSLRTTLSILKNSSGFRRISWKRIADCFFALSKFNKLSMSDLQSSTLSAVCDLLRSESVDTSMFQYLGVGTEQGPSPKAYAKLATLSYFQCMNLSGSVKEFRASSALDLAVSFCNLIQCTGPTNKKDLYHERAIYYTKHSIRLDPANELAWILLGDLNRNLEPKISQHAYIQALEINRKVCIALGISTES